MYYPADTRPSCRSNSFQQCPPIVRMHNMESFSSHQATEFNDCRNIVSSPFIHFHEGCPLPDHALCHWEYIAEGNNPRFIHLEVQSIRKVNDAFLPPPKRKIGNDYHDLFTMIIHAALDSFSIYDWPRTLLAIKILASNKNSLMR